MGNSSEDVSRMRRGTFDAVSVVDSALARLRIHVKELQVVVKVNRSSTEISTKESGMCREDGRYIHMPLLRQGYRNSGEPFVEVSDDCEVGFAGNKLPRSVSGREDGGGCTAYLAQKPRH